MSSIAEPSHQTSISSRIALGFAGLGLVIAGVAATALLSVWLLAETGKRIGEDIAPLLHAADLAVVDATQGFLLVQKIMNGDTVADPEAARAKIRGAAAHLRTVLDGAEVDGREIAPAADPDLRALGEEAMAALDDLSARSEARFGKLAQLADPGSDADLGFDETFDGIVSRLEAAAALPGAQLASIQGQLGRALQKVTVGYLLTEQILSGDAGVATDEALGAFTAAAAAVAAIPGEAGLPGLAAVAADLSLLSRTAAERLRRAQETRVTDATEIRNLDAGFEVFAEASAAMGQRGIELQVEQAGRLARIRVIAFASVGLGCLAILAGCGILYRLMDRRVVRRIRDLSGILQRLSAGDRSVDGPSWTSTDELGALSRAILRYREVLDDRERMQAAEAEARERREATEQDRRAAEAAEARRNAERERMERQAAEERALQMVALQDGIARVIAAAGSGNFAVRLTEPFADPDMEEIRHALNGLLENVGGSLGEIGRVLEGLARRDLSVRMTGRFDGAFAALMDNTNRTAETLEQALAEIARSAETVLDGSSEISTAARDLAGRTESTAASLEEASAAIDELTASVLSSAEGARVANAIVTDAGLKARRSEGVVNDAVAAMADIREFSHQIARTTSVINDIAFQTNLLALNAGVEAARAGESGRGFAVVASEVRALAQRSADAAREIESLIEKSSQQVENGVGLVGQAGAALREMAASISEITGKVAEIARSAEEQSTGIREVHASIGQIDQATQKNAAMFEETTAASMTLTAAAEQMRGLASRFRLREGIAAELPPGAAPRSPAGASARLTPDRAISRGSDRLPDRTADRSPAPVARATSRTAAAPAIAADDWHEF